MLSSEMTDVKELPENLDAVRTRSSRLDTGDMYMVERAAWSLVWLAVLIAGVNVSSYWWWSPVAVVLSVAMIVGGLMGTVFCWTTRSPRSRLFQRLGFLSALVATIFPETIVIHTRSFYSTDSAAFQQIAARALIHGVDPYVMSMSGAAKFLSVPSSFWTYTVTGGHVSQFSYPAGSAIIDALAMGLGFHHMVIDWVDIVAWLATIILVFALLPTSLRWLAALLAVTGFYLGTFSSGGTDAVFLPFLVLAVWRWDRFGQGRGAGLARWLGPVALGLACTVKQTPWFCVPLLAVGIFLEARRAGRPAVPIVLRYLSIVFAVFALVNLPFVIWQPTAWVRGTLTPLVGGLVANGQGLVALATHGVTGGVELPMLSLAGGVAMLATIAAYVRWYPYLKRVWLLLVPIPLFFAPRSLASYLMDLFPAALIAALSVRSASRQPDLAGETTRRRLLSWSSIAVIVPAIGVVLTSVLAFAGPPLQLTLRSIATSPLERSLYSVTVTVKNRTGNRLTPHFMVNTGNTLAGFWTTETHRPVVLGPHATETVTLYPPGPTGAPQDGDRWLVEAYTGGPTWLSTSAQEVFPPAKVHAGWRH
ncbi:MAG: hypothetical protein ACLQK4_17440 [Acidimicrobiales bacterium]